MELAIGGGGPLQDPDPPSLPACRLASRGTSRTHGVEPQNRVVGYSLGLLGDKVAVIGRRRSPEEAGQPEQNRSRRRRHDQQEQETGQYRRDQVGSRVRKRSGGDDMSDEPLPVAPQQRRDPGRGPAAGESQPPKGHSAGGDKEEEQRQPLIRAIFLSDRIPPLLASPALLVTGRVQRVAVGGLCVAA